MTVPPESHTEGTPQNPEQLAREDVLRLGRDLIGLIATRGAFGFDGDWTAKPILDEDTGGVNGAVFERDELRGWDELDRTEINDRGDSLHVVWTRVRPNVNTRTTVQWDSVVSSSEDTHLGRLRESDVVQGELGVHKTIHELQGELKDLSERVLLPPRQPRRTLWRWMIDHLPG